MNPSIGVYCNDNPIDDAQKGDETGREPQIEAGQEGFPLDGKEKRDETYPGENF